MRREMQLAWFAAWQVANLSKAKKLPPLKSGLESLGKAGAEKAGAKESVRSALASMRADATKRGLPAPKKRKDRE